MCRISNSCCQAPRVPVCCMPLSALQIMHGHELLPMMINRAARGSLSLPATSSNNTPAQLHAEWSNQVANETRRAKPCVERSGPAHLSQAETLLAHGRNGLLAKAPNVPHAHCLVQAGRHHQVILGVEGRTHDIVIVPCNRVANTLLLVIALAKRTSIRESYHKCQQNSR